MILNLRVDHRLLHGQVAFSWVGFLGANCILIANDDVVTNSLRKSTMKMAKPNGVKLVMKNITDSIDALNNGVTDKYKLFIVVENINDAYKLITGTNDLIHMLNLGGTDKNDNSEELSAAVFVDDNDKAQLKELQKNGVDVSIQQVPSEAKKEVSL
ncbi:PTS sugar transporter subunit IIB [Companilactobacillus insicii]|uniref:PTS sugar transporter subunit IIB n=1 Tax=Companilactobacillus insicii TaxID=1732567 RepID=UPI000F79E78B|nr:PTS sugar transporter subunit IIB [Companilactobacillus insicii]